MRRVTADPIIHRDEYTARVEKELLEWFEEVFFQPIRDSVGPLLRDNAEKPYDKKEHPAIWAALLAGNLWYAEGIFSGHFNAAISRELRAIGARKVMAGFAITQSEIPIVLRGAVAESISRAGDLHNELLTTLARMSETISQAPTGLTFPKTVDTITADLQEQLVRSVSKVEGLAKPTPTPPGFTKELREDLVQEIDPSIKQFTAEQIQELRDDVQKNFDAEARIQRLTDLVEMRFGVVRRRARGLAEQAVSNLVSKFREQRYRDLGSRDYDWEISNDEKVRHDHRELAGFTFAWSSPPITNRSTGARNHPGQDHNCRCSARPRFVIPSNERDYGRDNLAGG